MLLLKVLLLLSIIILQCSCQTTFICVDFFRKFVIENDPQGKWVPIMAETQSKPYVSHRGTINYRVPGEQIRISTDKTGFDAFRFRSCHRFNIIHACLAPYVFWNNEQRNKRVIRFRNDNLKIEDLIRRAFEEGMFLKVDMVLIDLPFRQCFKPIFMVDWYHFGFPTITRIVFDRHMKFEFFIDTSIKNGEEEERTVTAYLTDSADRCKGFLPRDLMTGADTMSTALYVNMIHKNDKSDDAPSYFFIKKESNICVYKFPVKELFYNNNEFEPKEFFLLQHYPTDGYAPKFFTFDPLYGTFVSLYWNKVCGSYPEAHFFVFNEHDPTKTQLVDKSVLKNFDQEALEAIFAETYTAEAYPIFASWGRQIYISFTKKEGKYTVFSGIWKDEKQYSTGLSAVSNRHDLRQINRDFVQRWYPTNYNPDKPEDNFPSSSSQSPFSHCLPATTTTTTTAAPTTTTTTTKASTTTQKVSPTTAEKGGIYPEHGHGKRAAQDDQIIKDAGGFGSQ